jgi:hypothetical protein
MSGDGSGWLMVFLLFYVVGGHFDGNPSVWNGIEAWSRHQVEQQCQDPREKP